MFYAFLGTLIMAIGVNIAFLPANLFSTAFPGLGVLLHYTFNFQVGLTVFFLNIPLFIIALKLFGTRFFFRNLAITALFSLFLDLLYPLSNLFTLNLLTGSIIGGTLLGIGSGLVFRGGVTSGGVGLMALLLQVKFKNLKMGIFHTFFDFFILFVGAILMDITTAFFTFISSIIAGYLIDFTIAFKIKKNKHC